MQWIEWNIMDTNVFNYDQLSSKGSSFHIKIIITRESRPTIPLSTT